MKNSTSRLAIYVCVAIFSIFIFVLSKNFFVYLFLYVVTDLQPHVGILQAALSKGLFPVPPLYYLSIHSLFYLTQIYGTSVVNILALSIVAKYIASLEISKLFQVNRLLVLLLLLFILIVAPINFDLKLNLFVGKLGMNVWHNSTTIFLMPFALLLFYYTYLFIANEHNSKRTLFIIYVLILLNVLSKPSFLFAFIPAFFILVVISYKDNVKKIVNAVAICFYSTVCIFLEYLYLYVRNPDKTDDGGVSFSFMYIWKHYSNTIFLDIITGLALPITVLILFFKQTVNKKIYLYAFSLFLVALIIFIFIQETGFRALHGNFSWQVFICNYILFLVSTLVGLEHVNKKGIKNYKTIIFFIVFLLHVAGGIFYLFKLVTEKNFY